MKRSLFEELKEYSAKDIYPFHMPGHKRSVGSGPLSDIYKLDITEIDGFDNLHRAEGILRNVQERSAGLYRSERTYFLINGSTAGILSAVSALAGRGRKLLIARNCHKAVYHAAFLNRFEIEYIYPEENEAFKISCGITSQQAEDKINEIAIREKISINRIGSFISGIVLTSPSYEGILSDIKGIVKVAHAYGIPVVVDQAHGAHFGFHPAFPASAVEEGADLVVHSVHKTLPAPTQTALLHHNGHFVPQDILEKYLRIYQSSSPSYILMAGIDCCMELVEREGNKRLGDLLSYRKKLMDELKGLNHIRIYPAMTDRQRQGTESEAQDFKYDMQEAGKLLISVGGANFSGQELYDVLREKYRLQMEMSGADYVIAILTMMDSEEGFMRLAGALSEIDAMLCKSFDKGPALLSYQNHQPERVLEISDAFTAESIYMPLDKSEGRTAADFVNFYPPGIPVLVPGERMDHYVIQMIKEYLQCGYRVEGIYREKKNSEYYVKTVKDRYGMSEAGRE